jgi:tripartite-type tricarboxylate transporter receptor subunit TctC
MTINCRILRIPCAALYGISFWIGLWLPAAAQKYPDRPVRVISTTPTAGAGDVVVRLIAEHVSQTLKQPIVIEAQPAATGQIATQDVVRAEPDGYLMLWGNSNLVNTQALKKNLPFNVLRDLAPVSLAVSSPFLLAVNSSLPINTLEDFVKYARTKPGELAFGSVGLGSGMHLAGESLGKAMGAPMTHIPYPSTGIGTMLTDLAENRIQVMLATLSTFQSILSTRKAKIIAVLAKERYSLVPQAQPVTDVLPNFTEVPIWFGMLAPAKTPNTIIDLWSRQIRTAVYEREMKQRLDGFGLVTVGSDPAQMADTMQTSMKKISALVKDLNIEVP